MNTVSGGHTTRRLSATTWHAAKKLTKQYNLNVNEFIRTLNDKDLEDESLLHSFQRENAVYSRVGCFLDCRKSSFAIARATREGLRVDHAI